MLHICVDLSGQASWIRPVAVPTQLWTSCPGRSGGDEDKRVVQSHREAAVSLPVCVAPGRSRLYRAGFWELDHFPLIKKASFSH